MGLGRYKTVPENEEGFYHCFVRCIRRAFLCGYDAVTNHSRGCTPLFRNIIQELICTTKKLD